MTTGCNVWSWPESRPSAIGRITLDAKLAGERRTGNPYAPFERAGAGDGHFVYRASPRPYGGGDGRAGLMMPSVCSERSLRPTATPRRTASPWRSGTGCRGSSPAAGPHSYSCPSISRGRAVSGRAGAPSPCSAAGAGEGAPTKTARIGCRFLPPSISSLPGWSASWASRCIRRNRSRSSPRFGPREHHLVGERARLGTVRCPLPVGASSHPVAFAGG